MSMSERDPQNEPSESVVDAQPRGIIDWYQGSVLAGRYLETVLADWKQTLILVLQAPALAGLAVLVWGNVGRATESLYFVMVLSCFWIGCMNAAREIVKERALFLREKMVGVDVGAYLYSKLRVLALLSALQVGMYGIIVHKYIDVMMGIGWLLIVLYVAGLSGTCLGLLISAVVKRTDYAVGLVPLLIIPQILFSPFAIKKDDFEGLSEVVYFLMPAQWGYESLVEFSKASGSTIDAGGYMLPMIFFGVVFVAAAYPFLRIAKY
jgi:hypothetical protein